MTIEINQQVPDFLVQATNNKDISLAMLQGYNVVLYFYPKDNTPGCTQEGQDFQERYNDFKDAKTVIFGISKDSLESHETFKASQNLPFQLISDSNGTLCDLFDVIKLKNMYGKNILGIERSTFLLDDKGVLRREWRKVKVQGHVEAALMAARNLNETV